MVDILAARRNDKAALPRHGLAFAVTPAAALAPLLPEWAVLAARSAGDNVFFHPDFAVPAIRAMGPGVAIATVAHSDRRLAALAPFTNTRLGRLAPAARIWAHNYGPLGLPLVDAAAVEAAVAALLDGLAGNRSLVVPDLPMESAVAAAFLAAAQRDDRPVEVLDDHVRAVIERNDPGAADPRGALSSRKRKEFARQMRRLGERGRVSIETRVEPDEVRSRFEVFLALEEAGWKGRNKTALLSSPVTAEFSREVVRVLSDAGSARIDSIDVDGTPVAMVVTFATGHAAFTWKIAYDEEYARYSPGAQLMLEVVGHIFSDPTITQIDSLATADHPMIDHIWDGRMAIGTLVIGPPGGSLAHRLGVAAAKAELAARAAARKLRG